MLLGQHTDVVSIGEANVAFKHMNLEKICSCGKAAGDCGYWGKVYQKLFSIPKVERKKDVKYNALISSFRDVFGDNVVICDSGKDPRAILSMADNPEIELYVIFLSKDIRGFVQSNLSHIKENQGLKYKWLYLKTLFFQTLYWLYFNRKHSKAFSKKNIRMMRIGYEELCLNTTFILNKTFDFLGIERVQPGSTIDNSKSHILWGNSMRYDAFASSSIQYDYKWAMNVWVNFVTWPLQFLNKKYAYSNTILNQKGNIERRN